TARSIWIAWQERSGDARAAAVFDLVAERTALRPTDAPGAMAWLRLELDRFGRRAHDGPRARRYASFAASGDRVPEALAPLLAVMRAAAMTGVAAATIDERAPEAIAAHASLREQHVLDLGGHPVIVTRRKTGDAERA